MKLPPLLLLAALPACVTSHVDNSHVDSRRDPLLFSGYAIDAHAPVQVRAWNHERNEFQLVHVAEAGDHGIGTGQELYGWVVEDLALGEEHWVGPGAGCASSGMAFFELRTLVGDTWRTLATFNEAGMDCLGDELAGSSDFFTAGATCKTGETLLLLSPGSCAPIAPPDPPLPRVLLRLDDDRKVHEVRDGAFTFLPIFETGASRPVRFHANAFDHEGVFGVQIDWHIDIHCEGAILPGHAFGRAYAEEPEDAPVLGTAIGTSWEVDVAGWEEDLCEGAALTRIEGEAAATAYTLDGPVASTQALAFVITP